jgi:hypothetical protein
MIPSDGRPVPFFIFHAKSNHALPPSGLTGAIRDRYDSCDVRFWHLEDMLNRLMNVRFLR